MRSFLLYTSLLLLVAVNILSSHAAPATQTSDTSVFLPVIQAGGRSVIVAQNIQAALDQAQPGDTIIVPAGTYVENLVFRRAGRAGAPITLRGAGASATIIQGAIRIQAQQLVIQQLAVDPAADDDAIWIEQPAQGITLQRLHLYGSAMYGIRIENDVQNVLIESSEINNFDAGSSDAHGIGIKTASNITIRGCNIHNNSGDAIQINTPDYPGYGRFARNILIENNDLHDNRENAVDMKSTHTAVVRNNRAWGFHVVNSSDGMAIEVQYDAQDIQVIGNHIWDAVQGIEITRGNKNGVAYPLAPSRVLLAGNLIHDIISQGSDSGSGSGIIVRTSTQARVYNNTILRAAGSAVYLSYSAENAIPTGVDVRNNVLQGQTNDLYMARDATLFANIVVDYNHYITSQVNGAPLAAWLAKGYEKHATQGDPLLSAANLPRAGSPLIDSGTDVHLPFTGRAPDRGWGEFAQGQ